MPLPGPPVGVARAHVLSGVGECLLVPAMERMTVDIVPGQAPPSRHRFDAVRVLAAAGLALAAFGFWARGLPAFVAWEVTADHQRCFSRRQLPARLWSSDPAEVREWLESRGTPTPLLPAEAGAAELVGARYCPLEDRVAAHVYYAGQGGLVSVFLLSGPARVGDGWSGMSRGLHVRLLRAAGRTVAIVGQSPRDVAATARAFTDTVARHPEGPRLDGSRGIRRARSHAPPLGPLPAVDRPRSS